MTMDYVLLVAWILGGSQQHYQVDFATKELCMTAAAELKNEAGRIGGERARRVHFDGGIKTVPPLVDLGAAESLQPVLSAICVKRK
jgi:hypothetical protein